MYIAQQSQTLIADSQHTMGSLRNDHRKWENSGGAKEHCKYFNNVQNYPLFNSLSDEILPLQVTPPPALHIMIGVFNHIWKAIENKSEQHGQICQDFAMQNNCVRENYHGKVFEGNECQKLMKKIDCNGETILSGLPGVQQHLNAIKDLNVVRINLFENNLGLEWEIALQNFELSYLKIPDITKPLKVHVLIAHTREYIDRYSKGKALGFYSEQTGEAVHQKFEVIFSKYKIKNIHCDTYGQNLLKAVVEFSSNHI